MGRRSCPLPAGARAPARWYPVPFHASSAHGYHPSRPFPSRCTGRGIRRVSRRGRRPCSGWGTARSVARACRARPAHPDSWRDRIHRAVPGPLRAGTRPPGDPVQSRPPALARVAWRGGAVARRSGYRGPGGAARATVGRLHRQPDQPAVLGAGRRPGAGRQCRALPVHLHDLRLCRRQPPGHHRRPSRGRLPWPRCHGRNPADAHGRHGRPVRPAQGAKRGGGAPAVRAAYHHRAPGLHRRPARRDRPFHVLAATRGPRRRGAGPRRWTRSAAGHRRARPGGMDGTPGGAGRHRHVQRGRSRLSVDDGRAGARLPGRHRHAGDTDPRPRRVPGIPSGGPADLGATRSGALRGVWAGEQRAGHRRRTHLPATGDHVSDLLRWFSSLPAARQAETRAGIDPQREAELLRAWHAARGAD